MKRLVWLWLLLPVIAAFSCLNASPVASTPAEVTTALYRSAMKNFGFSADSLKLQKSWLAPELYSSLMKKANEPVPKGDAPDIEGDVFLNSQEMPSGFKVGKSTIGQDQAEVEVSVSIPGDNEKYVVLLKQIDGAWKVCDVNYGKDGKLTDLLK